MSIANTFLKTALKFKPLLVRIIPKSYLQKKKQQLLDSQAKQIQQLTLEPFNKEKFQYGINLIGNIKADSGLGQSTRLVADILLAAKIPFTIKEYYISARYSRTNVDYDKYITPDNPYAINLVHIQPGELIPAFMEMGREVFDGHYNIAYWLWELEELPKEWLSVFCLFDEFWAPSQFICDCIKKYTDKPVVKVPYNVVAPTDDKYDREYFNLPKDKYLFVTMYDSQSIAERKNPMAVLEAYKKAFPTESENVGIVVKINEPNEDEITLVKNVFKGYKNAYFITETLSKVAVNSLIKCADCYASLHRSEGFGLCLAESMLLNTATIATNWSANTEFMNEEVGCMVPFSFKTIEEKIGCYEAGNRWADPDISVAAEYMKKLATDREFSADMVAKANVYVKDVLSMENAMMPLKERVFIILSST